MWVPFARDVIDAFLMWGFAVVSLEEENPPPFAAFLSGRRAEEASAQIKRQRMGSLNPGRHEYQSARELKESGVTLVPCVAGFGSYEVSWVRGGRCGYTRRYKCAVIGSARAYMVDDSVGLFVKTPPDEQGNIGEVHNDLHASLHSHVHCVSSTLLAVSPVATCFEAASFCQSLQELALNAEVTRSRMQLITQASARITANTDPTI